MIERSHSARKKQKLPLSTFGPATSLGCRYILFLFFITILGLPRIVRGLTRARVRAIDYRFITWRSESQRDLLSRRAHGMPRRRKSENVHFPCMAYYLTKRLTRARDQYSYVYSHVVARSLKYFAYGLIFLNVDCDALCNVYDPQAGELILPGGIYPVTVQLGSVHVVRRRGFL